MLRRFWTASSRIPDSVSNTSDSQATANGFTNRGLRQPDRLRVVGASVAGAAHERAGTVCQDAWDAMSLGNQTSLIAVADGAGSACLGHVGATVAVHTAIEVLRQTTLDRMPWGPTGWREALFLAAARGRDAAIGAAVASGFRPEDLATTLILVAVSPGGVAVLQIGDGGVAAEFIDGSFDCLTKPARGEFANETAFLTSPDYLVSLQTAFTWTTCMRLAVFTDGLERLAVAKHSNTPHAPFFQPLFELLAKECDDKEAEREIRDFLRSGLLRSRTDDDLTLILVVREPDEDDVSAGGHGLTSKSRSASSAPGDAHAPDC